MKAALKLQTMPTRLHVLFQDQSLIHIFLLAQFKNLQYSQNKKKEVSQHTVSLCQTSIYQGQDQPGSKQERNGIIIHVTFHKENMISVLPWQIRTDVWRHILKSKQGNYTYKMKRRGRIRPWFCNTNSLTINKYYCLFPPTDLTCITTTEWTLPTLNWGPVYIWNW